MAFGLGLFRTMRDLLLVNGIIIINFKPEVTHFDTQSCEMAILELGSLIALNVKVTERKKKKKKKIIFLFTQYSVRNTI